ncbi:MAG: polyribonucleotide nucleotidyltransferase, partial [Planctomycetota bacterium]
MADHPLAVHRVEKEIAGRTLVLETGKIAKQATAAVLATYGGSTVMATVVRADPRPGLDFFPMQVDYREKLTSAGKFPGGFRKREGAPNEKEVLTMRMIDRPIRPLFPDGFIDEVQIQCWVMSHDGENDTDVLAGFAASAALAISNAPFEGPTGMVRVGRVWTDDGASFVINPTGTQMDYSDLDLVLAGHKDGINMIEVGAAEIPDEDVLKSIEVGYDAIKQQIELIDELVKLCGQEKVIKNPLNLPSDEIMEKVKSIAADKLTELRQLKGKQERNDAVGELRRSVLDEHFPEKTDGTVEEAEQSRKDRGMAREAFRTLE